MTNLTNFDVFMGVGAIIQAYDTNIPMIIDGMDMPSLESSTKWIKYSYLGNLPRASRVVQINTRFPFELICYSRSAFLKNDGAETSFVDHIKMADEYSDLLNQKNFQIKNSCIRLEECRISILDLRSATFTAQSISTGTTPLLNCQAAVILVDGRLITNKE